MKYFFGKLTSQIEILDDRIYFWNYDNLMTYKTNTDLP